MSTKVLTFSILSFISAVFADDFKTLNGKEYKGAIVTRVEPDGIVLKTKSGIIKVYFAELPKDGPGRATSRCKSHSGPPSPLQRASEAGRRSASPNGSGAATRTRVLWW